MSLTTDPHQFVQQQLNLDSTVLNNSDTWWAITSPIPYYAAYVLIIVTIMQGDIAGERDLQSMNASVFK